MKPAAIRAVATALLWPALAAAHPIQGVGDFYSGMLHPLLALEQIVPMIALSLLAGQQERRTAAGILWVFPAGLIAGACAALAVKPLPLFPLINTAAMVVLGLLVAISRPLPMTPLLALAAAAGVCEGLPVGAEITGDVAPWRFIPGAGLAALVVMAYGIGLVRRLKAPWAHVAVRVAGSWVAAIGIMVLGLR
jgi:urease accessory protein